MLSFHFAALFFVLAVGSFATPGGWNDSCMTDAEAQAVATKYGELISDYSNAAADAILTPDFVDYGEGVNTLINSCPQGSAAVSLPLLQATFSNRQQFETGQGQQPLINFEQLQIWNTCRASIIRWKTTNTANITDVRPIIGLIVMEVERAPAGSELPWLIKTVYTEFDSGAWLQNLQEAGFCAGHDTGLPNQPAAPGCSSGMPGSPPAGEVQPPAVAPPVPAQQGGNYGGPQSGNGAPGGGTPTQGQSQPPVYAPAAPAQQGGDYGRPQQGNGAMTGGGPAQDQSQPHTGGYGGGNGGDWAPVPVMHGPPAPVVQSWQNASMPYNSSMSSKIWSYSTSQSAPTPWSSNPTLTNCEESSWTTYVVPTPTPAVGTLSTTYRGAYSTGRW